MPESKSNPMDRREFLQAGVAVTAAAASLGPKVAPAAAQDDAPAGNKPVLPTRVLGKTGATVTILNQGTVGEPAALGRLLRYAYKEGVRYFDTAEGYKNAEVVFHDWFQAQPEVRKSIFLATKSDAGTPADMVKKVDLRLKRLGTDYIDLLFFHGLDTQKVDWPKSKEMKEAIEAIKKTGKVKFVGFSTHDPSIAQQIQNAAEGGFVDVIMLKFSPWLEKDSALNKALDACHKANIGLVSMKQIGGQALKITQDRVPSLKERKLTPAQGLLHAIWTDERFSSACVTMRNTDQTNENSDAARRYRAPEEGRARRASRGPARLRPHHVPQLRRPMLGRRRHHRQAGRPRPLLHLPRGPRHPRPRPRVLLRARRPRAGLARRRPRSRPRGVPQQARLRRPPPRSRPAPRLSPRKVPEIHRHVAA